MVCLGLEPGAAGWKAQMNPLSYGSAPNTLLLKIVINVNKPILYQVTYLQPQSCKL